MEIHTEPYLTGWYDAIWLEGMELYCIQTDSAEEEKERNRARWTYLKFYRTTTIRINTSCHTMKTTENLITQCFQLRNSKDSPAHGQ